uniref:Uncharacterized protein n=1 Tax=Myotis myotis TaxID=51298 RepID=A0A7J7XI94_MYOMY|nr:hypothetical protein mMyoMyo1_011617 [Myotis myotis]
MRLFGPLSVALPQNTTCGRARTVRWKLHGPCAEVGFRPGRVYFEEVALEEVGGVGRLGDGRHGAGGPRDTQHGGGLRFMPELSEPVRRQSHCAVVSANRVSKSRAGDKSTYSKHKVTCTFPTSCKSYRYFCHQFKNCNSFVLVALLL